MEMQALTADTIFWGAEVKMAAKGRRQGMWARVLRHQDGECLVEFGDDFKAYFPYSDFVIPTPALRENWSS